MSEIMSATEIQNNWPKPKDFVYKAEYKSYEGDFKIPLWNEVSNVSIFFNCDVNIELELKHYCKAFKISMEWLQENKNKVIDSILESNIFEFDEGNKVALKNGREHMKVEENSLNLSITKEEFIKKLVSPNLKVYIDDSKFSFNMLFQKAFNHFEGKKVEIVFQGFVGGDDSTYEIKVKRTDE